MRRIPVTVNFDHSTHVGVLVMFDNVSDEEMKDLDISWSYNIVDDKLKILEMTFIPRPAVNKKETIKGQHSDKVIFDELGE